MGFDVGGVPDIIEHKINGYLAQYKSSRDLSKGIIWVIKDQGRNKELGRNGREKVMKEYSLEVQARRYKELYQSLS